MPATVTPASSVTTASTQSVFGAIVHGIGNGAAAVWQSSPWLAVLSAGLLIFGVVHAVRSVLHSRHPHDPVRRFSHADREVIFMRAGHRCEYYAPLLGRCDVTTGLHADHVHPHSRGGATTVSNAQALCSQHNITKSAHVPWDWQLARLAKRRTTYFPSGYDPAVIRHRPRATRRQRATARPLADTLQG